MTKPLSRHDVRKLTEGFHLVLQLVRAGELTASAATTYRLEGAVVALGAVLGEAGDLVEAPFDHLA